MRAILSAVSFFLATTIMASAPASAQDGWGWSIIIPSVTGTDQLGLHLRDQMVRPQNRTGSRARGDSSTPEPSSQPLAAPDLATLRYIPSRARRTTNLARFVEKTGASDPAGAASLQNLFAQGDIIERIGGSLAPHGLRVDDLADAYTVWWISAWQATKGTNVETNDRTNKAVRGQAARALSGISGLTGGGDAAKQEFAESLLIQSMLIEAAVDQAKGDPERLRAVGAAVRQGARGMGIDLSSITLTERGFMLAS